MIEAIISIIICYLIGSISPGIIITKMVGKGDIRSYGSGGTGATNVNRTLGTKFGLLVLLFDCLKAVIPILILKLIFIETNPDIVYYSAIAVLLGHIFPIYYKFKGGKGISVSLGILLVIAPIEALIALVIFLIIAWITRYIALSDMIAAVCVPLLTIPKHDRDLTCFTALIAIIVIASQKANIKRHINGNENKFSFKKADKRPL